MTDSTRIYGIIGDRIDYSVSPAVYNTIFIRHQVNAVYNLYNLKSSELKHFVNTVRLLSVAGFNVTTPHKRAIIPLLDRLDRSASSTNSVNLVLNRESRLVGYNTDIDGIKHSIERELNLNVSECEVVIFGSGGAATTVLFYLAQAGARVVTVVHRSHQSQKDFEEYAAKIMRKISCNSRISSGKRVELPAADLCINCTPAGMETLATKESLRSLSAIFELRYGDFPLLNRRHIRGNQMLAVQAALNLGLMEGLDVPYTACLKIINRAVIHD